MKLNKQIAAAYYGCPIHEVGNNVGVCSGILTVGHRTMLHVNCSSNEPYYSNIDLHKLVLWPLSAITDEDKIELAKIFGYIDDGIKEEHYLFWGNHAAVMVMNKGMASVESIDFLRASEWECKPKRAYDMGYGTIESLINAGIAIDANTL